MRYIITTFLLSLFAVGAFAQQPGEQQDQPQSPEMQGQGQEFSQLDADQDGDLTKTEAEEAGIEPVTFDSMDVDSNEIVTEAEFEEAKEGGGAR